MPDRDRAASRRSALETAARETAAPEDRSAGETPSEQAEVVSAQGDYKVVTVFYGTDRKTVEILEPEGPGRGVWLYVTAACVAIAVLLASAMFSNAWSRAVAALAMAGLTITVLMGITKVVIRGQAETAPTGPTWAYGNQRGELAMGTCQVSIPKDHEVGELESPSVFRFEFVEDPRRHVVLLNVDRQPADTFFAGLKARVERSRRKEAFVFIHGYNVTFETAARRTAQLAHDLKFDGAPMFYSWPSQGGLLRYAVDETNVVWTVPHLKEFLLGVARRSGAQSVHLIAHSMGNRALTSALKSLSYEQPDELPLFREVLLTAPDIDADVFRRDIAPAMAKASSRVTLYASSNDEALVLSKKVHGYPRAGDSGDNLLVVPGIDTIDVSAVDTSLIGNSYYGSNDTVIADMIDLLHESRPPAERRWLETVRLGRSTYWVFRSDNARLGTAEPQDRSLWK